MHEHRGTPDALIISHLPHGPTLSMTLHNVVVRHDVSSNADSTVSEQFPHLIFEGFSTRLGERVMGILRALFPVPKDDAKRVMTFATDSDFISFRSVWLVIVALRLANRLDESSSLPRRRSKDVQLAGSRAAL